MEDHGEEQDYHLEEYVEHDDYLGNFLLLRNSPQHKTGFAPGQDVFLRLFSSSCSGIEKFMVGALRKFSQGFPQK